jgi:hypothetical protein
MKLVILIVGVLMLGGVYGAPLGSDWDSFDDEGDSGSSSVGVNVNTGGSGDSEVVSQDDPGFSGRGASSGSGNVKYTDDFYLALGIAALGIFIIILFAYLFFRKPREKWKKRKPLK